MSLEKIALIAVVVFGAIWALLMLSGIVLSLPFGLPVLAVFGLGAFLLFKVVKDRLDNTEDDYYEKNIHQ